MADQNWIDLDDAPKLDQAWVDGATRFPAKPNFALDYEAVFRDIMARYPKTMAALADDEAKGA